MKQTTVHLLIYALALLTNLFAADLASETQNNYLCTSLGYKITSINNHDLDQNLISSFQKKIENGLLEEVDTYISFFNNHTQTQSNPKPITPQNCLLGIYTYTDGLIYVHSIIAAQSQEGTQNLVYFHIPDLRPETENNCCIS